MKTATRLASVVVALVVSTTSVAKADSYSFEGSSGRFDASVWLSGFNEGAGEGGWSYGDALAFAITAARFNAIIPKGSFVSMHRDAGDDETTLTIRSSTPESVTMPDGPDYDEALAVVARHFNAGVPPVSGPTPKLFTIQLSASHFEANATRFARSLDDRGVSADGSFYSEACHPCSIPEAHVLDKGKDGFFRVVMGIFDQRDVAERSRQSLERKFGIKGFVREMSEP
jgi:hypothetical protein